MSLNKVTGKQEMSIWHEKLLPDLCREHLIHLHRECCEMRGKGWKNVNFAPEYVWERGPAYLVAYHTRVMNALHNTYEYIINLNWLSCTYRGEEIGDDQYWVGMKEWNKARNRDIVYPEHDTKYLRSCKAVLDRKSRLYSTACTCSVEL